MDRAGDSDTIDIDWEDVWAHQPDGPLTFTHNHPLPGSFSADDVAWGLKARVREVRAVDAFNTHSLRYKPNGRVSAGVLYLDGRQRIKSVNERAGPPGSHGWRDELDRVWSRLAQRYDLRYDRCEAPGKSPR